MPNTKRSGTVFSSQTGFNAGYSAYGCHRYAGTFQPRYLTDSKYRFAEVIDAEHLGDLGRERVAMETLRDLAQVLQPFATTVTALVSLKDKASGEGASSEFTVELNDVIIDMQAKVMDAQNVALQVQAQSMGFMARISEVEAEVTNPTWKARYHLHRLHPQGDAIYKLRDEHEAEEAMHEICTVCCDVQRAKAILTHWGSGQLACPSCHTVYVVDPGSDRPSPVLSF